MFGPLFPELLAAAQDGDEQAFAALWRDLQPAVLRYFRVTAGRWQRTWPPTPGCR
jgi:RNA polymerase sigma-70 factor, ECF subfamily